MLLEGSCHCRSVRFTVDSHTPYPYMRCYCSICRKTAGGGGYAINIMAEASTLSVKGAKHVTIYQAWIAAEDGKRRRRSEARRHFCVVCGSALYVFDPRWQEWVYPFASAIDTPLPTPPERVELMLSYAAPWADVPSTKHDIHFPEYPAESIVDWHRKRGLYVE